jgi:hypothetical protein
VPPVEKCCRYFFYFLILFILLLFSLLAMVFLVAYQNTLPKGTDCLIVGQDFISNIAVYVADYTTLVPAQAILTATSDLTSAVLPIADFALWKTAVEADTIFTDTTQLRDYVNVFFC